MKKTITIRYGERECGWAEPLGGDLARISNMPVMYCDEFWQGDIVRIGPDPEGRSVYPVIKEVVETRYPSKTFLEYQDEDQLDLLRRVLAPLGAAIVVLREPDETCSGDLVIGHSEEIDPVLLAEGVGVEQSFICDECLAKAAGERFPITQDEVNAIWAKYEARDVDTDEDCETIHEEYTEEIRQLGGDIVGWDWKENSGATEFLLDLLQDRGCVILDNPEGRDYDFCGYIVFWPEQQRPVAISVDNETCDTEADRAGFRFVAPSPN
jgi:hypothetical protein